MLSCFVRREHLSRVALHAEPKGDTLELRHGGVCGLGRVPSETAPAAAAAANAAVLAATLLLHERMVKLQPARIGTGVSLQVVAMVGVDRTRSDKHVTEHTPEERCRQNVHVATKHVAAAKGLRGQLD